MKCFHCDQNIYPGEEYYRSSVGNVLHVECFICMGSDDIFEFFGEDCVSIKATREDYES
jgi:hypothetical protein